MRRKRLPKEVVNKTPVTALLELSYTRTSACCVRVVWHVQHARASGSCLSPGNSATAAVLALASCSHAFRPAHFNLQPPSSLRIVVSVDYVRCRSDSMATRNHDVYWLSTLDSFFLPPVSSPLLRPLLLIFHTATLMTLRSFVFSISVFSITWRHCHYHAAQGCHIQEGCDSLYRGS